MAHHCSTGKRCYDSLELAREGLIALRANNSYGFSEGPKGVYRCPLCDYYHLTSSRTEGFELSAEDEERVRRESEAKFWEDKIRKK